MDEREKLKGRSPEELQYRTRQAFESIPVEQSVDTFFDEINPSSEELHETLERIANRKPEIKPILINKFDALIEQSPTTPSFKKAMHFVLDKTLTHGRMMEEDEDTDMGRTEALIEVLQLETSTGIYLPEGAKKAEAALYEFIARDFSNGIEGALLAGIDPFNPENREPGIIFSHLSMGEYKDFILNWYQEFTQLYNIELDRVFFTD